MKKWKLINRTTLLEHPRLNVYEDDVELPNGNQTKYIHFGKKAEATSIIPIGPDRRILVQKEMSYPINEWLYQFPGGAVEPNETIHAGALRELEEEAGHIGKLQEIGKFYVNNRRSQDAIYVFVATELVETATNWDAEEDLVSYWFTISEINEMIATGEITNPSMLCAWALFCASDVFPDQK